MILSMMAVGFAYHAFGRAKHAGDLPQRNTALQKPRCAGVPQNVRRNLRPEASQLSCLSPCTPLLRRDPLAMPFDHILRGQSAPATNVRQEPGRNRAGWPSLPALNSVGCAPVENLRGK